MTNWKEGDPCRVIYTVDGLEYEAVIDSIVTAEGDTEAYAIVHYKDFPETVQVLSERYLKDDEKCH
jgi:hypothetical protein